MSTEKPEIAELDDQIAALKEAVKTDPDNGELPKLIDELQLAKRNLLAAVSKTTPNEKRPVEEAESRIFCTVEMGKNRERVGEVIKDEGGKVRVVFLGVQVVKEIPNEEAKYLTSVPAGIFPGAKMQGVYENDGLWYDCTVVKKIPGNFAIVKFEGYNEEVEIRLNWLRIRPTHPAALAPAGAGSTGTTGGGSYVTPAGYKIPEKLRIEDKDSEKVKAAKKRKIEEIKKEQRGQRKDDESETRKKSWADFKKSVGGSGNK